jgi:hypothetical protein
MKSPSTFRMNPQGVCQAYKKASCWLPRKASSTFCATCLSAKQRDDLKTLLAEIPSLEEDTVVQRFLELKAPLASAGYSSLDTLLHSTYLKSKPLTRRIVQHIETSPLRAPFLLRVMNHSRTGLCAPFNFILRHSLNQLGGILPQRCLCCLASVVRYGDPEQKQRIRRMLMYQTELPTMVRNTLQLIGGRERLVAFQDSLVEMEYAPRLIDSFEKMCKQQEAKYVHTHPLTWTWETRKQETPLRIAPWKEEFIAKSWHPSRVQHWCFDIEERARWGDDFPQPTPLTGTRADWNIPWQ